MTWTQTQKNKETFSSWPTDTDQAQVRSEAKGKPPVGGLQYGAICNSEAFNFIYLFFNYELELKSSRTLPSQPIYITI